mmetsp:Transcript_56443/g.131852  ORF Transcript_56443/g.131852 Transcript_56443/m.131852 type:complete len:119 (+) Transcript_56443:1-357(+)
MPHLLDAIVAGLLPDTTIQVNESAADAITQLCTFVTDLLEPAVHKFAPALGNILMRKQGIDYAAWQFSQHQALEKTVCCTINRLNLTTSHSQIWPGIQEKFTPELLLHLGTSYGYSEK